ncbi:family 43 glycosylhydrolase [Rufibacter quisquiliarum]|uniref:Beta-xylosidase n=1 Tax=Rufibacter quisquiliarum TaxID=1549639 RepID=A0A839GV61_9BACT|nr:family 43 glycosylhydrolase [Rufibacter quisquiliarum]MBA9078646.1 beta-xylosidase [Rufibacter quisquiliarum]
MKKLLPLFGLACLLLTGCAEKNIQTATSTASQPQPVNATTRSVAYTNPVLPGDYADPSVVRVGDDYWATATSSEWAPLFPLLHSKNLVDWETVGHVFPEKSPAWAEAHFWAPEISYENGKYYIYYTAKKKGGNLCVGVASATNPKGPYTDHGPLVCQEVGSIDGFPIRDEKGDLYLIWKEDGNSRRLPTPLWGQRMNEERTGLTGEKFELFRNDPGTWEGGLVEGPALVRKNGYYYMFYAGDKCCGRECTYGVGVARAKNLRGPWEKYAKNPIMQQNDAWKCAGHGTVVSDQSGRDFFLYHAYTTGTFVYPGRQGLLDEISWNQDGWPYFKGSVPSVSSVVPYSKNAPEVLDVNDEFKGSTLAPSWQWSVTQAPPFQVRSANNGQLVLKAHPEAVGSMLGQRTKTGNYTATAALDVASLPKGTMAGLSAFGDPNNSVGIGVQDGNVVVWQVKRKQATDVARVPAPQAKTLQFKVEVQDGNKLSFSFSPDGQKWTTPGNAQPIDGSFLPPWDRGVRVGLSAKGPAGATAAFDWFKLTHSSK